MKNTKRYLSLIICMTMIVSIAAPDTHATGPENEIFEITSSENHVVCYIENSEYECCTYIDSNTGTGSFSVEFSENSDYIYEYHFTIETDSADLQSPAFWSNLVGNCFSEQADWTEVYIPNTITVIGDTENGITPRSSAPIADQMKNWLKTNFGTSEYTGTLITSTNIAGYNFMLYEDLEYSTGVVNSYVVKQALSVTSFVLGVLQQQAASTLVALLVELFGSNTVPANSNIKQYYLYATWTRYVKRQSSGYRLSNTQRITTYDGYYVVSSNSWGVYEGSEFTEYPHSQSYFNNYSAQFTDAYNYYLNHYA